MIFQSPRQQLALLSLIIFTSFLFYITQTRLSYTAAPVHYPQHLLNVSKFANSINAYANLFHASWIDQSEIADVLEVQRSEIASQLSDYEYHPALKVNNVSKLIPELGGNPVRSVIITTWRSGSTFIGDVLLSHPATYYHYEPLLDFDIVQVRGGPLAKRALFNLNQLLRCNYTSMDHYLSYGRDHQYLFGHNRRLWRRCMEFPHLCWEPKFLSPFCKLFPFQSLKTVRLRANLTTGLLRDKELNLRILLLIRDPRAIIQSRHHRDWCPGNPDCYDPSLLCSDLVSDYASALKLRTTFPYTFKVVRYEDLSLNAYNITREIFDFFRLTYSHEVQRFLDTHTKRSVGGVSSTFRDSKTAPVHWTSDLSWGEVDQIQESCTDALKLWGYVVAHNESHLRSFNPIGSYLMI